MKNIVVTGGAGYLGSTLVKILLRNGYHVCVFDNLLHGGESLLGFWDEWGFDFIRGDILDEDKVSYAIRQCDAVVHLASIVGDPACSRVENSHEINVEGSKNVIRACKKSKVGRLIFASTCSNYGNSGFEKNVVDESSPVKPISSYARDKVEIEKLVLSSGVPSTVLRFSTLFGPSARMRFDLTVNEFVRDAFLKKSLEVFSPTSKRPYVHVFDAARAIVEILTSDCRHVCGEIFNVGKTTQNYSKYIIVAEIQKAIDNVDVTYTNKEDDGRNYFVDFSKLNKVIGFLATRDLNVGILEVLQILRAGVISEPYAEKYRN